MLHYFTYGSNLHPLRLIERVPSATLVCVVELSSHELLFHKRSHDGSAKCNLLKTTSELDSIYGSIYSIDSEHKKILDNFEGVGNGYIDKTIVIQHQGQVYNCFTYHAQQSHIADNLEPYHWYKELVILGARYLQLPTLLQ